MLKIKGLMQVLVCWFCLIPAVINAAETDLNISSANDYMRQVRKNMDAKTIDFTILKNMLVTIEDLNEKAVDCVEKANSQLQAISELEKDNGLTGSATAGGNDVIEENEDAIYIQNKKRLQTAKLAECRLFVFKSQDLIVDLKDMLHDASTSDMLTVSEPMWQILTQKSDNSKALINILIISLLTISVIWCLWLVPKFKFMRKFDNQWSGKIASGYRILLASAAIIIVSLELIGYRQLAVYLSQGALLTVGLLVLFILIVYLGNTIFVQEKILKSMVITKKHKLLELKLLKFSLYALTASWFILLLLQWWGVPLTTVDKIKEFLLNGFTLYGIKIIPMRLLTALLVFSIIQIVGKYFAVYISKQNKFDGEADTQVAISSLITYVVFSIALVCGLLVSGVDFTGLAIVAGALSVGIGLGLQNVVNNFVSGIILLLEKSIRPGDRIMIKGTEGFVKKINFRYTRIVTLLKEDVMMPNSDLITNPITNFVYKDKLTKLKCTVGVAYDSDIELVKETLLNVALQHSEVLNDPLNKPIVALKEFAESNIIFELICVVNDIDNKYTVNSEINFAIVKAFRQNNIVMAFPQLDVHNV